MNTNVRKLNDLNESERTNAKLQQQNYEIHSLVINSTLEAVALLKQQHLFSLQIHHSFSLRTNFVLNRISFFIHKIARYRGGGR